MVDTKTEDEQQPISDDQELAKVLAGITGNSADATAIDNTAPVQTAYSEPDDVSSAPEVEQTFAQPVVPQASADGLEEIKKNAIVELRPLVDKLNLVPEEKFDTYLLLLRSTDDKELIAPAHEAAKNIVDEARRAQALLDIIKEIDFLSGQNPAA